MDDLEETTTTSTALGDFLFPAPAERRSGAIVRWWESRRIVYNGIVGSAGLVTLVYANLVNLIMPGPGPLNLGWIFPIVAVGVAANLFYFLGPLTEVVVEKIFRGEVHPTGPVLYRMGLTFSVGLMLLPSLIWTIMMVVTLIGGLF